MNNHEKLKKMTKLTLARFLGNGMISCPPKNGAFSRVIIAGGCPDKECWQCWNAWLKEEAK